jgi:protoheme IX farnesyltransferase
VTDSLVRPVTTNAGRASWTVYLRLTKPRVIELLLVTTLPAMLLAEEGLPSLGLVVAVLVGGTFAAGGANTINCWIERDRDRIMARTRRRPLPSGEISPRAALVFGLALEVAAFAVLTLGANALAASLALTAAVFYVGVYTIWLKPRSSQNIVIGGAAGAVPALVGWAAVTGSLAAPAWVLFAVVFLWTPPHFWALALRYKDDYAAAGIPMLPVVRTASAVTRQMLGYSVAVVATSLLLMATGAVGAIYLGAGIVLGVGFIGSAIVVHRDPTRAITFFHRSNLYLALLFAAVGLDALVR